MKKFQSKLQEFLGDENGATAIEYGLIAALMAVGAIASFTALNDGLLNLFGTTTSGAGGAIAAATAEL